MINKEVYENSIILIGPIGVGKSTMGELLSRTLGLSQISLDSLRKKYYPIYGFDKEYSKSLLDKHEEFAWLMYQKQFELKLVKDVLDSLSEPAIIDFGATQACEFGQAKTKELAETLQPFNSVFYLKYPRYQENYAMQISKINKLLLNTKKYDNIATDVFECDILENDHKGIVENIENGKLKVSTDYFKLRMLESQLISAYRNNSCITLNKKSMANK